MAKRYEVRKVARSAIDGRFKSRKEANLNPNTTVVETIRYRKRGK